MVRVKDIEAAVSRGDDGTGEVSKEFRLMGQWHRERPGLGVMTGDGKANTLNYMRYIERLEGELAEKNLELNRLKDDRAQAARFAEELRERLIPCDEYGRSIQPEVDLEDQINTFLKGFRIMNVPRWK